MLYTLYLVDNNSNITETISLDVINSFGEDYSSNLAQNAVESGYSITDSISINNPKFSISGVITDSKFRVSGQLVVFNGNTFEKSQGDNREQFQQISDDDYAEKVKTRLIKLWENKEVFGILESKDINNVKGTQVRNIFPCALASLNFAKSDAAAAIYPTMSIEKIRYAVVSVGKVTNPLPELTRKYVADQKELSKTTTVSGEVKGSEDDGKSILNDAKAKAVAGLGEVGQTATNAAANIKMTTEYLIKNSYANAINSRVAESEGLSGTARINRIHEIAEQSFNRDVKKGLALEDNPKFVRRSISW